MKTPEKSVEEIVEDIEMDIVVLTKQHANKEMSDYEYTKSVGKLVTKALQAERQRCEEMVEAERERVNEIWETAISENYSETLWGNDDNNVVMKISINNFCDAVEADVEKALTQPNNK